MPGENTDISEESQEVSINDLEQKAKELALVTRAKGMGVLDGKFPENISGRDFGKYTEVGCFMLGENVTDSSETSSIVFTYEIIRNGLPSELRHRLGMHQQVWFAQPYRPPVNRKIVEVRKGFLKKERQIIETPKTYHGKKGESDWTQYDYCMPVLSDYDISRRPGIYVNLSIAVPPEIAIQIDELVNENPYFPDVFFKALYPGKIGPDPTKDITRLRATELLVVDRRKDPKNQGQVRQYPTALEY